MSCRPPRPTDWTEAEIQLLYDHINEEGAAAKLVPLLPNRLPASIKVKLSKLRAETGIRAQPQDHRPGMIEEANRHSSEKLAEAIEDILWRARMGTR